MGLEDVGEGRVWWAEEWERPVAEACGTGPTTSNGDGTTGTDRAEQADEADDTQRAWDTGTEMSWALTKDRPGLEYGQQLDERSPPVGTREGEAEKAVLNLVR